MDRFLLVFGSLVFLVSLIYFMISLIHGGELLVLIVSLFGMLNASIAIGISEILSRVMDNRREDVS